MAKKDRLGKGLNALFGEMQREAPVNRDNSPSSRSQGEDVEGQNQSGSRAQSKSPAKSGKAAETSMDDYVIARDDDKITISHINIAEIHRHEGQPRRHFDKAALEELAESISQRGVLQPVMVRPRGKGGFELIAGERRWRAAQIARLHEIRQLYANWMIRKPLPLR